MNPVKTQFACVRGGVGWEVPDPNDRKSSYFSFFPLSPQLIFKGSPMIAISKNTIIKLSKSPGGPTFSTGSNL